MPIALAAPLLAAVCFAAEPPAASEPRQPPDPLDGPPLVTCRAWAIADGESGELLHCHNADASRAMASTTKIMTALIVLQAAQSDPAPLDEMVTVSARADETSGSTAGVRAGERLAVADLLYGLLLPSGNDAAVALGEHFGGRFAPEALEAPPEDESQRPSGPLEWFVAEMNRRARQLGLRRTRYLDPHGNSRNRSSAADLVRLTRAAWQNERFRRYVNTRRHTCRALAPDGQTRTISWKNTNQLLDIEGYGGVKTGTTGAAGACLVSSGRRGEDHLFVVVLGSTSKDARYTDTRNLFRWAWRQRGHGGGN